MKKSSGIFRECPHCKYRNELPFFFCSECGEARVKLSRWQVMVNLSLTFSLFLGASYFRPILIWNWPLFLLYYFFLAQFALSLVRGYWRLSYRVLLWVGVFFVAYGVFFQFLFEEGAGIFFLTLDEVPLMAKEEPLIFFPALGAVLVLILLPAYFRWSRIYGWVMSYRILIVLALITCLLGLGLLRLVNLADERGVLPTDEEWLTQFLSNSAPEFKKAFLLGSVSLFRLFIFEIAVFSAVQGYTRVHRAAKRKGKTTFDQQSGFARSLMHISLIFMRIGQTLESMAAYLLSTLLILGRDLARVLLALSREIIIPILMMSFCGLLIYRLVALTDRYLVSGNLQEVLSMIASILGVLFCTIVFLYCKSAFRWSRIISFYTNLAGWLLPNLLLFFLLLSISLYLSGSALNRLDPDAAEPLNFRIGVLTILDATILLILVAVVLIRKGGQFSLGDAFKLVPEARTETTPFSQPSPDVSSVGEEKGEQRATAAVDADEEVAKAGGKKDKRFFFLKRPAESRKALEDEETEKPGVLGFVRKKIKTLENKEATRVVMEKVRHMNLLLQGKPRVVTELTKVKEECEEKQSQLVALQSKKDAISEKLFSSLRTQYQQTLDALHTRRQELQAEVDKQYAEQLVRVSTQKEKVEEIKQRKVEIEQLQQAGAMSQKDYRKQLRQIRGDLESQTLLLEGYENILRFLAEEATPGPSDQES